MKRLLKTIIVAILLLSMSIGIASAAEVQYIKINPHELVKSYDAHRVEVNITTDTIGNLAYIEEYYAVDAESKPKFVGGTRHEENLTSNTIAFEIMRPRDKDGKEYTTMKVKVTMDNVPIFEEWIPLGSTYKLNNLKKPKELPTPKPTKNPIKIPTVLEKPNNTENMTVIATQKNPEIPGFGIITAIIAVLAICIARKVNIGK